MMQTSRPTFLAGCVFVLAASAAGLAQGEPPLSADELRAIRIATVDPSNQAVLMDIRLADLLKIGTGAKIVPIRQRISIRPDGKYYVSFSLRLLSDDVVFSVQKPGVSWFYKTDSSRVLLAAAVLDVAGARAVPTAEARDSYRLVLQVWSDLARNGITVARAEPPWRP
jgi:hypothetical protein